MDFSLATISDGGTVRVTVTGEVDLETGPVLRDHLASTLTRTDDLVVDVRDVTFMDSTGLQSLVATRRRAQLSGERLRLCVGDAGPVVRLLTLTGLTDAFELEDAPGAEARVLADETAGAV